MTCLHHQVAFRVNQVNTCGQKTSLCVLISLEQDMKSPPFGGFSILTTYKGKGIKPMEGREGADELQPN